MSSQLTAPPAPACPSWRSKGEAALQHALKLIRKHPLAFVVAVGAVFGIAFLGSGAVGSASLRVQMQHGFRSAEVSVWVDNKLAYTEHVTGSMRKRFGLIPGGIYGSFSHVVQVGAGRHSVRVRVASAGEGYDHTGTISGDFPGSSEVTLQITPRRSGDLALEWQGMSTGLPDSEPAWYVKYANTLLMTAVGSAVSALTAFVIKELPNLLRRTSEPKV